MQIVERRNDTHHWVDVLNDEGRHLFSHINVERAEATLRQDHREQACMVFTDPSHAPALKYRIVRLEGDARESR